MESLSEAFPNDISSVQNNNIKTLEAAEHNLRASSGAILCRINFQINGFSQQLLIQQRQNLQSITSQLIDKLNNSHFANHLPQDMHITSHQEMDYLKQVIKNKLSDILVGNTERSLQAVKWRNKMKQIIEDKNGQGQSCTSRLSDRSCNNEGRKDKKVTYFGHNVYTQDQNGSGSNALECQVANSKPSRREHTAILFSENKEKTIYDRMKALQQKLNNQTQKQANHHQPQEVHSQNKQNLSIKQFLSKMHGNQLLNQQLSECTFHPPPPQHNRKGPKTIHCDVFQRLYLQAINKGQKMKQIQKKAALREQEAYKLYNFIPTINECSKKIVKVKKEHFKHQNNCSHLQNSSSSFYHTKRQQKTEKQRGVQRQRQKSIQKQTKRQREMKKQNSKNLKVKKQCAREPLAQTCMNEQLNRSKSKPKSNNSPLKMNENAMKKGKISSQVSQASVKHKVMPSTSSHSLHFNHQPSNRKLTPKIIKLNKQSNEHKRPQKLVTQTISENITKNYIHPSKQANKANSHKLRTEHYVIEEYNTFEMLNSSFQQLDPMMSQELKSLSQKREDSSLQSTKQKKMKERLNPLQFFQQQEARTNKKTILSQAQTKEAPDKKNIAQGSKLCQQASQQQAIGLRRINQAFSGIYNILANPSNLQEEITYLSIIHNQFIPTSLRKILYPMAAEMKELGVGLDREEFIWSISRIFQALSDPQKQDIWLWSLNIGKNYAKTRNGVVGEQQGRNEK